MRDDLRRVTRSLIVAEARSWIGTPYAHLQREKGRFTDCVGLVIGVARALGLGDYRKRNYARIPDPVQMEIELKKGLDPIPESDARPGDILWFAFVHPTTRKKIPRHVGIIGDYALGGLSVIHAYAEYKKVVEHRLDGKWQRRICGAFSYREVAD